MRQVQRFIRGVGDERRELHVHQCCCLCIGRATWWWVVQCGGVGGKVGCRPFASLLGVSGAGSHTLPHSAPGVGVSPLLWCPFGCRGRPYMAQVLFGWTAGGGAIM